MKRVTVFSTFSTLFVICFFILILSTKECDSCFSPPVMMMKVFTCGLVVFIGSLYFTGIYRKFERLMYAIESLPILDTDEASDGVPFSGYGDVQPIGKTLLTSPYTKTPCVYFHSIKERYQRSGKHSKWVVVQNVAQYIPFFLADDRGKLKVDLTNVDADRSKFKIATRNTTAPDPDNSEIDATTMLYQKSKESSSNTKFFGITFSSSNSERFSEFVLTPNTRVFAMGQVSRRDEELVLHESERYPLVISQKSRDVYIEEFYKGKNIIYLVHLLMTIGFSAIVLSANYFLTIRPNVLFLILYGGNGLIFGSIVFTMYNRITTLKQRADNALSNIDVELRRRSQLIPRLVSLAKKLTKHEKEVQTMVTQLRVNPVFQSTLPEKAKSSLNSLYALSESYPKLKTSKHYKELANDLVDTEERIASARGFYNRNVRKYNTLIQQFPFLFLALTFGMKKLRFVTLRSTP